ncbi:MAG: hypothetical protein GYA88_04840 [Clostridiales bacterium]|jgi:hypothetical protein|nr:hypothetical protein [Clostridiales bacterium]
MPEKELYTKKDKAPLDIGKCGIILLARVLDVRKHLKLYEKRISAALKNKNKGCPRKAALIDPSLK